MRSEYAAAPWLVGLGPLVPRVVGADFTHQVVDRDYLVQTLLVGTPAPELMSGCSRSQWPGLFAQLGGISRRIQEVPGETWGPVAAPVHGPTDLRADAHAFKALCAAAGGCPPERGSLKERSST